MLEISEIKINNEIIQLENKIKTTITITITITITTINLTNNNIKENLFVEILQKCKEI
jgi:hypothetical protein